LFVHRFHVRAIKILTESLAVPTAESLTRAPAITDYDDRSRVRMRTASHEHGMFRGSVTPYRVAIRDVEILKEPKWNEIARKHGATFKP
jgi:hypothetical protein